MTCAQVCAALATVRAESLEELSVEEELDLLLVERRDTSSCELPTDERALARWRTTAESRIAQREPASQ